jgi:hypothetical protein
MAAVRLQPACSLLLAVEFALPHFLAPNRWATFIGLGILLVTTPITSIFMKKIVGYRRAMLRFTDQRVKLMNQLLVGIRVLKMYAWEVSLGWEAPPWQGAR